VELNELVMLFVIGIIVSIMVLPILFLKNRKLSKSAKILYSAKINRKMDIEYRNRIIYFILAVNLIILVRNVMSSVSNDYISILISNALTLLCILSLVAVLILINRSAKKRNLKEVQITDKGIMAKNVLIYPWTDFKGYLKKGKHIALRFKYLYWIMGDIYLLNDDGKVENIIKRYLRKLD